MMKQRIELINDVNDVPKLAEWVDLLAEDAGLAMDKTFQLNLALEEAVVNVMNYAYPGQQNMPIFIEADMLEDRIVFEIIDAGIPFDPTRQEEPDLTLTVEERPIGGLGIMLVRQFMTDITYEYIDGKNHLLLTMMK